MTTYTPTTAHVRNAFVSWSVKHMGGTHDQHATEFDQWLAQITEEEA